MRKREEESEILLLRSWIVLIRYRLDEISMHRLFVPTFELDRVKQMIDREMEQWPADE